MLSPARRLSRRRSDLSRRVHTSPFSAQVFKQKQLPLSTPAAKSRGAEKKVKADRIDEDDAAAVPKVPHAKRNELGVQMLSRQLHGQIFRNVSFPAPPDSYVRIAQEHLRMHGLDPTQGSVLPDTGFTLPQLQGNTLLEHFHRIGTRAAQPWLRLAQNLADTSLPPRPDHWDIQSGWTKYHYRADGASYSEAVETPMHDGVPEEMLVFDVETMPPYHPHAVMAIAASPNAWYAWISPWLLGETADAAQLVPFGAPDASRVVVGHNVSYDRARVAEEYALGGTRTRFLDTMALHVAVQGISSHQRPAWMKYRKSKQTAREQHEEAVEAVVGMLQEVELQQAQEVDVGKREELRRLQQEMEESLPQLQDGDEDLDAVEAELSSKRWEEVTSANSLADVAKLHCNIVMDKEIRNDFMKLSPAEIRENIVDYLGYCANDVHVTHCVFSQVLPAFLTGCPHPVSFAGILTMGSSFLPVNEEWEEYLKRAESVYREMDEGVKNKLSALAEEARTMMNDEEKWKRDPWLRQLDWTPKVAGKSRGIMPQEPTAELAVVGDLSDPQWYAQVLAEPFGAKTIERILPLLLRLSYDGHPLQFTPKDRWHLLVDDKVTRMHTSGSLKTSQVLNRKHALASFRVGRMTAGDVDLTMRLSEAVRDDAIKERVLALARRTLEEATPDTITNDPWLKQLDWKLANAPKTPAKAKPAKPPPVLWPKWYWDATRPRAGLPPGTLDITVRNRVAPLLLRLSWLGWPLVHSREHGWAFRVPADADFTTRLTPLTFFDPADETLSEDALRGGAVFYKLPHKDGAAANVGNPLGKTFMKYAQDGTLRSPGDEAREALDMNAQCSYWISARDRIMNQMVVWEKEGRQLGFGPGPQKWGVILPQVITMGTVTRRAIEKTWLTASNAKTNRVGSELKAMVRAPPGFVIVGADVDSEELWISSCMGDAQFGLHGATAIGWMTLEGTKAAGTDLHSKTAGILGISRDQAKVFNYSRIYGAGMRHAVLLLLQSNALMLPEEAQKLAENLYASTKGKNTHRTDIFGRKFWFGGTESFVFNKLEEIALSDKPATPALGCGVTHALSKEHLPAGFGADYMPSRINWVVQSSGVDYLHLLIVSMEHLLAKYDIRARYLISVHDELRYLVADEDRYRAGLALQIANLWTRSLFALRLGMDDLPQGVAFFSAVDVDRVLRKEVDMSCVTPSQPQAIAPGESLDIAGILARTGGSLWRDGRAMDTASFKGDESGLEGFTEPNCLTHRAPSAAFLRAQATTEFSEVKHLAQRQSGRKFEGGIGGGARSRFGASR